MYIYIYIDMYTQRERIMQDIAQAVSNSFAYPVKLIWNVHARLLDRSGSTWLLWRRSWARLRHALRGPGRSGGLQSSSGLILLFLTAALAGLGKADQRRKSCHLNRTCCSKHYFWCMAPQTPQRTSYLRALLSAPNPQISKQEPRSRTPAEEIK